jgi:hypothetical protein
VDESDEMIWDRINAANGDGANLEAALEVEVDPSVWRITEETRMFDEDVVMIVVLWKTSD